MKTPTASERGKFIAALRSLTKENPHGALLPVRELRSKAKLPKAAFDAIALGLQDERLISLHHHDAPGTLSAAEREQLVRDARGTHYNGIAFRGEVPKAEPKRRRERKAKPKKAQRQSRSYAPRTIKRCRTILDWWNGR